MWSKQLGALIGKDLRLHGRAVALATLGSLVLLAVADRLIPDRGAGPRVTFVGNLNLLLTLLWSDWLITRERSKRTFAWLRALPVDDRVLVGSKFATAAVCCVFHWVTTSALFARELWQPVGTGVVVQCAVLTFGALSVATKWRFPFKVGQIAPLIVVLVPILLVGLLAGNGTDADAALRELWNSPHGRPTAAATLLLLYGAIVWATLHWVIRTDTHQLVD